MEIMSGFRPIKKPVIPKKSIAFPATITVTDILFLTKMQKRANSLELELPFTIQIN